MTRWTHAVKADHEPDPHYPPDGKWDCYKCRQPVLLDGQKPPTQPIR